MNPKQALALRPDPLPPVEPELRTSPPRPSDLWLSTGSPDTDELLSQSVAATAWTVDLKRWVTSGAESGPEIRCRYAFLDEKGHPVLGRYKGSFDGYHLYVGSPDFARWLDRAFAEGSTFTVLYPPGRPKAHRIYGTLEVLVKRTLARIVTALQSAEDPSERDHLTRQVRELLSKTASSLEKKDPAERDEFPLLPLANIVLSGRCDRDRLDELSSLCGRHVQEVWAAR